MIVIALGHLLIIQFIYYDVWFELVYNRFKHFIESFKLVFLER